jgi:UDP-N-acetylglucosamine:LPS N-acetylglucosamine transferase
LKERAASLFSVEILGFLDPIDKLLAAADLVITKGTFGITCECAALGIPSIALSSGINPMDDFLVPRFQGTTWLNASALTPATLAAEIQACNMREKPVPIQYDGAMQAAEYLIRAAS